MRVQYRKRPKRGPSSEHLIFYHTFVLFDWLSIFIQIKELERDLDTESKRSGEAQKLAKKNERRMKEIQFQADEDQKNLSRAQENSERLNNKIKKMRVAVEEAVRLNFFRSGFFFFDSES